MDDDALKALKQLRQDYCQTFNTQAGERVLNDLKKRFFWSHSTFKTGFAQQDIEVYINEGGRRVLLTIDNIMTLPIEELIKEEEENASG